MIGTVPKPAMLLLNQIRSIEAPKGYDTVFGNRMKEQLAAVGKPLTQMTFDEVVADGKRRTSQYGSSACGAYQFMRNTLDAPNTVADLKGELNLTGKELFSKELQIWMGYHLLKRRGYDKFMSGKMSRTKFGNQLAMEWASYPVLSNIRGQHVSVKRGDTYYKDDGLNKVLISPDKVEAVLDEMLRVAGMPVGASPAAVPTSPLPDKPGSLETAVAPSYRPSVGGFLAGLWAKLPFGRKPAPAAKFYRGDPIVYSVQEQLQARGYYMTGLLDGNPAGPGSKTRAEINAIRADNGMAPGYIDEEFLAKLPTFGSRPVSKIRENGDFATAKAHNPDLAAPVGYMWKAGAALLTLGGVDAAQTSDFVTKAQQVATQGSEALTTLQSAATTVGTLVGILYAYKTWIIVAIAIYLFMRAASFALDFITKFKRAIL